MPASVTPCSACATAFAARLTSELVFKPLVHRFRVFEQYLLDGPVARGGVEGLVLLGQYLLLVEIEVVCVALPVGVQELGLVAFPDHVLRQREAGAEQLDRPVAALGRLVFLVDGLGGVALVLHELGDLGLGKVLAAVLRPLPQAVPELLVLVPCGGLEVFLLLRGEVVPAGVLQLAFDEADADEAVDGIFPLGLLFLVRQVDLPQRLGQPDVRVDGGLQLALCKSKIAHAHHHGIVRPGQRRAQRQHQQQCDPYGTACPLHRFIHLYMQTAPTPGPAAFPGRMACHDSTRGAVHFFGTIITL